MATSGTLAFRGRTRERQALDGLLDCVRGGDSAILVIRGEAGIICARTVEWHLRKVFAKLGITSRRDLHRTR